VGQLVVQGAMMSCTFGMTPATLQVTPEKMVMAGTPAANIMDFKPNVNIMPFGMCMSMSNPQVASATAAAQGVLTPQPCIPVTTSPWTPGSAMVLVKNQPALTNTSTCTCTWGGMISISNAGQMMTQVT
jgi:Domain of unknown function (DUF4280)